MVSSRIRVGLGGGGSGSGSAVAYSAHQSTALSGFHSDSFVNRFSVHNTEVNTDGLFTIDDDDAGYARIVIPEDGNYLITFASYVQAINTAMFSSARLRFRSQIVLESGDLTAVVVGSPGDVAARGGLLSSFASGSTSAEAVEGLLKGDLIHVEYQTFRDSSNTTATIETEVYVIKLQAGPAGPPGSPGADGLGVPPIEEGDAGRVLTVNNDETDFVLERAIPAFRGGGCLP